MGQRLVISVAQFLCDVLVVGCMHIKFVHWLLSASRWLLLAHLFNRQDEVFRSAQSLAIPLSVWSASISQAH